MGYTIDGEGATAAFKRAIAEAPKSGVSATEAETFAMTRMAMVRAEVETYAANFSHPDEDIANKAFEAAFAYGDPVCKRLSAASTFVKPGPFQASGRPQTFGNFIEFRAETGTVDDMMTAVDMYSVGYIPDPGYTKEIALTLRAAEKRSPKAAIYLVAAYVTGKGVEKSPEKAFLWTTIANRLGQPDAAQFIPGFKNELGPEKTARIEAEAEAWLKAH